MSYRYKVVPFIGRSRGSLSASDVAQQLETTISQHASAGWEFVQLTDVNIEVQPGCLGGLLGGKVEYARFDQLIFRSESTNRRLPTAAVETGAERQHSAESSPSRSHPHETAGAKVQQSINPFQPERLANGKIKCWSCGTPNDPHQIRCTACDAQLYFHQ
jgi:hypothetical protein